MPDGKRDRKSRGGMPAQERRSRSRLVQLLSSCALLRGTLSLRERTCGKPGCRCTRGHKHAGLYLVWSEQGRLRQRFVSREQEAQVRLWVAQYQEVRRLLEALVQMQLDQLARKDDGGGA